MLRTVVGEDVVGCGQVALEGKLNHNDSEVGYSAGHLRKVEVGSVESPKAIGEVGGSV